MEEISKEELQKLVRLIMELNEKQGRALKTQTHIIDEMFRLLLRYTNISEMENLISEIEKAAKMQTEIGGVL